MLRIQIEVCPADGKPRVVETVRVVHVTEDERGVATYGVTREGSDQQHTVYHRRAEGALKLARLALGAALGEGIPSPEGWVTPEQTAARGRVLADLYAGGFETDPAIDAAVDAEMREAGLLPSEVELAARRAAEQVAAAQVGPFGEPLGCSCGCGAACDAHCWRNSDWAEETAAALPAADPEKPEDPRGPDGIQGSPPGGQNTTLSGPSPVDELTSEAEKLGMYPARPPGVFVGGVRAEAIAEMRRRHGKRDGLEGLTPGGTSPEYLRGYQAGWLERAERTRRHGPGPMGPSPDLYCPRCDVAYSDLEREEHLKC